MKLAQTNDLPDTDSRHHALNISKALNDLAEHARNDTEKVSDDGGRTLLDATAETLAGLAKAHEHFAAAGDAEVPKRWRLPWLLRLLATSAPAATIWVRFLAGGVFLSEGIQKFLFPAELGAGRFAHLGLASPEILGPFVGGLEILCGALLIFGFLTRLAAIALIGDIAVAVWTTKVPMLTQNGVWPMLHASRADWCMLTGCIFLLIVGAGKISFDHRVSRLSPS